MLYIDGIGYKIDVLSVKRTADFLDKYALSLIHIFCRRANKDDCKAAGPKRTVLLFT